MANPNNRELKEEKSNVNEELVTLVRRLAEIQTWERQLAQEKAMLWQVFSQLADEEVGEKQPFEFSVPEIGCTAVRSIDTQEVLDEKRLELLSPREAWQQVTIPRRTVDRQALERLVQSRPELAEDVAPCLTRRILIKFSLRRNSHD